MRPADELPVAVLVGGSSFLTVRRMAREQREAQEALERARDDAEEMVRQEEALRLEERARQEDAEKGP